MDAKVLKEKEAYTAPLSEEVVVKSEGVICTSGESMNPGNEQW